ncbi:flagellar basal-body rod protein FlgF [Legionella worsleiensis]|uniref:Flagellar basal-body rod protein FlgF n=1 Tax=Legionella worsleiensis TaxID=45076 RepID=A0A0W1A5T9_9GAMM|nr:flagellar basal-body rod protein FlgF [Legionella worsleiensis]KTD76678.1 flagellar basal body rod protein FlgF [Legionella worsleiensis]STY30427.1 flagellar basal-body rod protein FlgF [Legionella worsleiensis]
METVLYTSTSAGYADLQRQSLIANNLANLNTPGFKADLYQAYTMYMSNENGVNNSNGQTVVVQGPNNVDMMPGEIITTGRDLDVAIDGDGWLAIRDGQGKEVYTRGGSLRLSTNGQLVTASGQPVLGDGGPISIPPAKSIEIGNDGTITIVPLDGDLKALAILDRLKLVSLDKTNVVKTEDGYYQLKQGGVARADANIRVISGAIEGSNVSAVEQMVEMISAGREFDAHMKVLSTSDENAQKLAQLLQQ